jgi:hypothetical protein
MLLEAIYATKKFFFFLTVYQCENLDNVDGSCGYCKYWKDQGYDCDWCDDGCTVCQKMFVLFEGNYLIKDSHMDHCNNI